MHCCVHVCTGLTFSCPRNHAVELQITCFLLKVFVKAQAKDFIG